MWLDTSFWCSRLTGTSMLLADVEMWHDAVPAKLKTVTLPTEVQSEGEWTLCLWIIFCPVSYTMF